jgi:hypothetical protein
MNVAKIEDLSQQIADLQADNKALGLRLADLEAAQPKAKAAKAVEPEGTTITTLAPTPVAIAYESHIS